MASYQESIRLKLYLRTFRRAFRNNCGMAVIMSLHISVSTNEMQKMGIGFTGAVMRRSRILRGEVAGFS